MLQSRKLQSMFHGKVMDMGSLLGLLKYKSDPQGPSMT